MDGKSLLPVGIVDVRGHFEREEMVHVENRAGQAIARGISSFSSEEMGRIQGKKQSEVAAILQVTGRTECIHRNNLVLE